MATRTPGKAIEGRFQKKSEIGDPFHPLHLGLKTSLMWSFLAIKDSLFWGFPQLIFGPSLNPNESYQKAKCFPQLPLIDFNQFPGSLTHLRASGANSGVHNALYMCTAYSTTCFMLNSHLWGMFQTIKSQFGAILAVLCDLFIRQKHTFCNKKKAIALDRIR